MRIGVGVFRVPGEDFGRAVPRNCERYHDGEKVGRQRNAAHAHHEALQRNALGVHVVRDERRVVQRNYQGKTVGRRHVTSGRSRMVQSGRGHVEQEIWLERPYPRSNFLRRRADGGGRKLLSK